MKRWLTVVVALIGLAVVAVAPTSAAPGVNLAWASCGGVDTRTFACNTNSGINTMVVSVSLPVNLDLWASFETDIILQSDDATLPDWWKLKNAGTCRPGATVLTAAASGFGGSCTDPYLGAGLGGIGAYNIATWPTFLGANRARILAGFAIPAGSETPLVTDVEYGVCAVNVNNSKTVGLGACAGCASNVCLSVYQVTGRQPAGSPGGDVTVTTELVRRYVRWQNPSTQTCGEVPVRTVTWGSIKALYR